MVSHFTAELGRGFSCVTVRLQTCVANQDQAPRLPICLIAISFQPCAVGRYPAAVTVALGGLPPARVAVSTTLKLDSVVAASRRRCGAGAPAAPLAALAVASRASMLMAMTTAGRRKRASIGSSFRFWPAWATLALRAGLLPGTACR